MRGIHALDVEGGVGLGVAERLRRLREARVLGDGGALPDLRAKRIIDEAITPAFRAGDYVGGLNAGIDRLSAAIAGEGLRPPKTSTNPNTAPSLSLEEWLLLLFFGGPVAATFLRRVFGAPIGALLAGAGAGALAARRRQAELRHARRDRATAA